jgi:hypothetical protein
MTYVLLTNDGEIDSRPGAPTVEELTKLVGDGVPELVRTPQGDHLVAWVNDNWISKVEAGEFRRNKAASILLMVTGTGALTVYGGPVVLTSLTTEDGQFLPGELEPEAVEAVVGVTTDVVAVLSGQEKSASFWADDRDDEITDEMATTITGQIKDSAAEVDALPLTAFDGGYSREKAVQAQINQLRAHGMPEFLIEIICQQNGVPYTPPASA